MLGKASKFAIGSFWLLAHLAVLGSLSHCVAAEKLGGKYQGSVENITAGQKADAEFWIEQRGSAISGCFSVSPPLSGSGPVQGQITGDAVSFTVDSPLFSIEFKGKLQNSDLVGNYKVRVADGSTQYGSFHTSKVSRESLPSNFAPTLCAVTARLEKLQDGQSNFWVYKDRDQTSLLLDENYHALGPIPAGWITNAFSGEYLAFKYPKGWVLLRQRSSSLVIGSLDGNEVVSEQVTFYKRGLFAGFFATKNSDIHAATDELVAAYKKSNPDFKASEGKPILLDLADGKQVYVVTTHNESRHGPETGILATSAAQGGIWYWQCFVPASEFSDYAFTFASILKSISFPKPFRPQVKEEANNRSTPAPLPSVTSGTTFLAKDIARKIFPSVVLLLMKDSHGSPISLGSGFVVAPNLIATNLHVLKGAHSGVLKVVGNNHTMNIDSVVATDSDHDLAIVRAADMAAPELELSDMVPPVGETIYAAGNPEGLEGTFSEGLVSANREEESLLQITAPISRGSSGGPIVDSHAKVVGVAVGIYTSGQNLNFAIPSKFLLTLLRTRSNPKTFPIASPRKSDRDHRHAAEQSPVTGGELSWTPYSPGVYSFSIHNWSRDAIKSVYCQIVFFDKRGVPIEVDEVHFDEEIPPGLAKRASSSVDESIHRLAASFEVRILDFAVE